MTQENKIWHTSDELPEIQQNKYPDVVFQRVYGQYLGGVWNGHDFITVFDEGYPPNEIKRWAYIKDLAAVADMQDKQCDFASRDLVGKVCWFWSDFRPQEKILGILVAIGPDGYYDTTDIRYDHCVPAQPTEIQFYNTVKKRQ